MLPVSNVMKVSKMRGLLVTSFFLIVGGCTMIGGKPQPPVCPGIVVHGEAASVTRFISDQGRGLLDQDYVGKITGATLTCSSGKEDGPVSVNADVVVTLNVERGPANRSRRATLNYFVGVMDDQQNVLNKVTFSVTVEFPGNRTRLIITDTPIALDIPIAAGKASENYSVFVGFQLTRQQFQYNRKQGVGRRQ